MDPPAYDIIDSHIHLFPASEIDTLAWQTPDHPLHKQHSLEEYKAATKVTGNLGKNKLRGFVFVETDRVSHLQDESGWKHPLQEVEWLARIASGQPRPGEGHDPEDAAMCLSIVPWAPVPNGSVTLERYIEEAASIARDKDLKIGGFRYLVQDKRQGTMVQSGFTDSLKHLGRHGWSFDLGVDQRSGGIWQLDEAVTMIQHANSGVPAGEQVKIVLNHLCKPDMLQAPFAPGQNTPDFPSFKGWEQRMKQLAAFPNTYMKLSGGFSEISPLPDGDSQERMTYWERHDHIEKVTQHMKSWIAKVLELWGPSRCMFGSDWPVSNINGGGNAYAWPTWRSVVAACIDHLPSEEQKMIWAGTAEKVYQISL